MAPVSNAASLENLNGSARSVRSYGPYQARSVATNTTSRAAGSAHPHRRHFTVRTHHTYPAPAAREYQYADNSAAGYHAHHTNRNFVQTIVTREEPASLDQYSPNQAPSGNQSHLFSEAPIYTTQYDRELELDEDQDETLTEPPRQYQYDQPILHDSHSQFYPTEEANDNPQPCTEYENEEEGYYPSNLGTDSGEDGDEDYTEQPSTPPHQATYSTRPHSPTTQRFLRADSPEDRLRLGLPRYETPEQQRRAYELITGYFCTRRC